MPHQRKYVVRHSAGTASNPSRANRRMASYASQGFISRFNRSTRCAFVSVVAWAMLTRLPETPEAEGRDLPAASASVFLTSTLAFARLPQITQGYLSPGFTARALRRHPTRRAVDPEDRVPDHHLSL